MKNKFSFFEKKCNFSDASKDKCSRVFSFPLLDLKRDFFEEARVATPSANHSWKELKVDFDGVTRNSGLKSNEGPTLPSLASTTHRYSGEE